MTTPVVLEIDRGAATLTMARDEHRNSLDHVAMRKLKEALASAQAFAGEFAARVDRDTVDVAKRILNDANALPPTAATLVNLLAERSDAFEGS